MSFMVLCKKRSGSSRMQLLTWKPSHLLRLGNHGESKPDIMRSFPSSKNGMCAQPLLIIRQNEKECNPTSISSYLVKSGYRKRPIRIYFIIFFFFDWKIYVLSLRRHIFIGKWWYFTWWTVKLLKQSSKLINLLYSA